MNNVNPIFGEILSAFTTTGDTLTRREKARDAAYNERTDLESATTDLHCAFKCLEEWLPDEAVLIEQVWERVSKRLHALESGHV